MLIFIFDLLLVTAVVYFVGKWAYRAWKKADLAALDDEYDLIEEKYKKVENLKKDHKDIKEKKDAINKFKNQ